MKVTNKHRLPIPLWALTAKPFYYTEGRMGATTVIMPPRIHQLRIRHDDELEEDASDRIWMLLGTKVHKDLEEAGINLLDKSWQWVSAKVREILTGMLVEKKYTMEVDGITVVCVGDVYVKSLQELDDYKITSVWSVIDRKPKEEWIQQLNINRLIYQEHGHVVNGIYVTAILRDWSKNKAKQGGNYPQAGVRRVTVPMWSNEQTMAFIRERIRLHKEAKDLPDDQLPECTAVERFARPDQWAVRKSKNKRADKLFFREEEAKDYLKTKEKQDDWTIDFRRGQSVRCEDYCPVVKFCNQAKKYGIKA